jgi:hypothetical protein
MNRRHATFALCAAALLASAAAAAPLPEGPAFGNNRIHASIDTVGGAADTDDYVAEVASGETIDVAVAASKKSALHPDVRLIDPTGADRTPALKSPKSRKSASFRKFAADVSGRWTVRIAGADGTEGAYDAAFAIHPARDLVLKRQAVGGSNAATVTHAFAAAAGSKLSFSLTYVKSKKTSPVNVVHLHVPSGGTDPLFDADVVLKRTTYSVKDYDLGGTGAYGLEVGATGGAASYSLHLHVTPPDRPRGKLTLAAVEPRLATLSAPTRVASGFAVHVTGTNFSVSPMPRLVVGGREASVTQVAADGTSLDATAPVLLERATPQVTVVNADGQAHTQPGYFFYVPVPQVTDLTDDGGTPSRKTTTLGGDLRIVVGTGFDAFTTVRIGLLPVTSTDLLTAAGIKVTMPASDPTDAHVIVADEFGRQSVSAFTVKYPRRFFGEPASSRFPAPGATDSFAAVRGAVGDLDKAGGTDDVVIVAPLHAYSSGYAPIGTRSESTRVLFGAAGSTLQDGTSSRFPSAFPATAPFDTDDWNARAVAIGDLDGKNGGEIVIAGFADTYFDGAGTGDLYGSTRFASGVRIFKNDGSGNFALDSADCPLPESKRPDMTCVDQNGKTRPLFGAFGPDLASANALAIGDLDKDGDLDIVLARNESSFRRKRQDAAHVDFTQSPPLIQSGYADAYAMTPNREFAYVAGTEILDNDISHGNGFSYVTETRMPLSFGGYSTSYAGPSAPGFQGDDVAIGDVNGDSWPDIVITWHDPLTVSVKGLKGYLQTQADGVTPPVSADVPRVATRVLLNDTHGRFTDATATWMPAGAAPEFWQGDRVALVDLDGDNDLDLVIESGTGLDEYKREAMTAISLTPGGTSAGGNLPSAGSADTYSFSLSSSAYCVVETSLVTLTDSRVELFGPNDASALIARNYDGGVGGASRIARQLAAGTYYVKVAGQTGAETGTYTLSVTGRADTAFTPSRSRSALRILENRGNVLHFVDVTASALPAPLGGNEDFHGRALLVRDFDGDGSLDIAVATADAIAANGAPLSSTRIFVRTSALHYALRPDFLPAPDVDTMQAQDLLYYPANPEVPQGSLVLLGMATPGASARGAKSRMFDWNR